MGLGLLTVGGFVGATLGVSPMKKEDEEEVTGGDDPGVACPDIPPPSEKWFRNSIKSEVDKTGFLSVVTGYKLGDHGYIHCERLATVPKVLSLESLVLLMSKPMLWPYLWMGTFPHGGVHHVVPNVSGELQVTLTRPFLSKSGGDPVRVSDMVVSTSIPKPLVPKASEGEYFLSQSFLARTEVGHALTGSVRHCLIVCDGVIYGLWVGVGSGPPVLGDVANYAVALHPVFGTWPLMCKSLKKVLADDDRLIETINAIKAIKGVPTTPPSFTPSDYTVLLGRALTTLGQPVRWGSSLVGLLTGTTGTVKGTKKDDGPK
jgi:hypothetical protein